MKILVLGAAFDPPHNGHKVMASQAIQLGLADRIVLMPCGSHAFDKKMSPAQDRLEMTKLLVAELSEKIGDFFEISDMEIKRSGVSYTHETLKKMAELYPNDQVGWLMGSDQLRNFDKWERYQEILKYPVYVYPRKKYPFEPFFEGMREVENVPLVEISSSQVREKYLQGQSISDMVNPQIQKYIETRNLWTK